MATGFSDLAAESRLLRRALCYPQARMAREYKLKSSPARTRHTIQYERLLNEEQLAVVTAGAGPLLVIAGAGTGKTRALTYRVARLIEDGTPAERILLLTFTNRAAREMTGRVTEILGARAQGIVSGTFHSVARRLLRPWARELGYPQNFSIIDVEDATSLMKKSSEEIRKQEIRGQRFPKAKMLVRLLSTANNTNNTVEEALRQSYPQFIDHLPIIRETLLEFQSRKVQMGVMDFDDLLINWARCFNDVPDAARGLSTQFDHVLVDEYQDTNAIQAAIVDCMCASKNLTVVGDDCQSIYSFRGAEFRNILEFPERHEGCQTFYLTRNYRSSPEILRLANRSIANNENQYQKELTSTQRAGSMPALVMCDGEGEEASFVCQRILELREEDIPLDNICVLYRAHHHAMELQIELSRRNIPFIVRSGIRFFEQRHIKDVVSFMRFIENPRDEIAFDRVVRLADGIGPKTAAKLHAIIKQAADLESALSSDAIESAVPSRARNSWADLRHLLLKLLQPALRADPAQTLTTVVDEFYRSYANISYSNADNRVRELGTIADYATRFDSTDELLQNLSLSGAMNGRDVLDVDENDEYVVLSTIHQAKGLEFNTVFVLSLAEDRFPSSRATFANGDLEEERRLFYVAATRAQRELYLTRPMHVRTREHGVVVLRASRFVEELHRRGLDPVLERWNLVAG